MTHGNFLKIVNSTTRNGRLDFHVIMEIALPLKITNVHISNLNDILISTKDISTTNRFFKLNMELISKRTEFPVLHEFLDERAIYSILVNYDRFPADMNFLRILGHHITDRGNFIFFQGDGTVEALELRIKTMVYTCKKTGKLPYFSRQSFDLYIIDHLNSKNWFRQKIEFYVYSKKVSVFKSMFAKVMGVLIVLFLVFILLSYTGYLRTKKKKTGFTPAEL